MSGPKKCETCLHYVGDPFFVHIMRYRPITPTDLEARCRNETVVCRPWGDGGVWLDRTEDKEVYRNPNCPQYTKKAEKQAK